MTVIRSLIIDDDAFTRQQLLDSISRLESGISVVASCENAIEGAEAIRKLRPSLVFLDIRMPGISGFEMLDSIGQHDFEVIFITSYNEYAIKAIRYSALDYLLKPIRDHELQDAVSRYRELTGRLTLRSRMNNLMHNIASSDPGSLTLLIPTRQGEKQLPVNSIIRCEADSNYTHFFLTDRSKFTASKTLKEYESVLAENDFIRVHKSHIINRHQIEKVRGESCIVMKDNSEVEISRRRWTEVRQLIGKIPV